MCVASGEDLGLFAAAIVPSSLSLIATLYPDPVRRGRAISAWAAISGVAMAAGPVFGGWLIAVEGWRAVFVVNAPLALVVLALCRTSIASTRHARAISSLPHVGLAATLATATVAITQAGQRSWLLAAAFGLAAAGLAYGTAAFDRSSPAPLIPAALRRNRAVWTAFGWGAAVNYALTTVIFSIPLLLNTTAVAAGATLLPMTALVALNPLLTGRIVAARGPLRPIQMGFIAFPVGLSLVAVAVADHHQPVVLALGLLLSGLGVSWTLPALVGFAVNHASPEATGSVGGILNATRQVGATIAAAVASALLTQSHRNAVAFPPFLIAAAVCVLGLVTAAPQRGARTGRPTASGSNATGRRSTTPMTACGPGSGER